MTNTNHKELANTLEILIKALEDSKSPAEEIVKKIEETTEPTDLKPLVKTQQRMGIKQTEITFKLTQEQLFIVHKSLRKAFKSINQQGLNWKIGMKVSR